MTASALCKDTGIPDSKIYYTLDGLSKKGMLIVQRGNPNVFLPIPPKEAVANLKQQMTEIFNEKIKDADVLVNMLTPLYDSAENSEALEVAYLIRGQKNIISRMKALIETAKKEITVFISYSEVLKELSEPLRQAEERGVKLSIAMTEEAFAEDSGYLGEIRLLTCSAEQSLDSVGMLISDMKTLLTVSNWMEESALLTQDKNLIRIAKGYYDSPSCCTSERTVRKQ